MLKITFTIKNNFIFLCINYNIMYKYKESVEREKKERPRRFTKNKKRPLFVKAKCSPSYLSMSNLSQSGLRIFLFRL